MLTETNVSSGVRIPDDIIGFLLNCSNNLTQFDEGYMDALEDNLNLTDYDNEIDISLSKFKNIRNQISDIRQR